MQFLKSLAFNILLYTSLIPISLLIIILYPCLSTKSLQKISSAWLMFIIYSLKYICNVNWRVEGLENIPSKPCIFVSNHQSAWESFFIQTLHMPSSTIIKIELLFIPFFGWALACLKPIHLRRKNKLKSLKRVLSSGSRKLQKGFSIIIFPEGTRAKPKKGLKKFSSSCGSLSVMNNVPIVPICHNSGLFWKDRQFVKEKGTVVFRIGKQIYGNDPREVTNEAYRWISANFEEIN